MCHSLSEAESCGLVHRDIKPANIFLCRYGEDHDFVKVLDFGLVKGLDGGATPAPDLTAENFVQGTPAFIAPEQALGGVRVDGRADIYATGCVAYWLLTGEYVFTGDTPMAILMHHVSTEPVPPSDPQRATDSTDARADRARVPGEGSGGSAADRARVGAEAGGSGSAGALERVTGAGVVDAARGGRRQRVRSETPPRTGVAGFTSPPCRMFRGAPWSEE